MEKASRRNNYHYNKKLRNFARSNRFGMTKAAAALWKYVLRAGKMEGYTFRRERPILWYIADFACLDLLLVIEVDGATHDTEDQQARDRRKDQALEAIGFKVLRFTNGEVLSTIDTVADMIRETVKERERELA